MNIYLVGGAVRDELLGHDVHDRDYVVIGASETDLLAKFPNAKKIGDRHAVFIHRNEEYTLSDFTDIQSDLMGRDLTINALAKDETGRIWSHPDAFSDLKHRILRPVHEENFYQDPLRVFRAARIAARFPNFKFHSRLEWVMRKIGGGNRLHGLAAERVGNEVLKACAAPKPGRFIRILSRTKCLLPWFRELDSAHTIPAGPAKYHPGSLLDHITKVMDIIEASPRMVWMGLCHDLGKSKTAPELWPRHHGHDIAGESAAIDLGRRLRLPKVYIQAGSIAARWHMLAAGYDRLRPGTKVDMLMLLHRYDLLSAMFELVRADKNIDLRKCAAEDLKTILAVKLGSKHRDQGKKSGQILHQMRTEAISK